MIQIGLIGEDSTDTGVIANLLRPSFGKKVQFIPVVKGITGDTLRTPKFSRMLEIELKTESRDIYVFTRDADGIATEIDKIKDRREWYRDHSKKIRQPTIFLLNVYELEALIFADIDTFNGLYSCKIKFGGDVTMKREPKEELMRKTGRPKKYHESHCPDIFSKMNLETVKKNCRYFAEFVAELNEAVAAIEK